jgi:hypothetical protein
MMIKGWRIFGLPFDAPKRSMGGTLGDAVFIGESDSERFRIEPPRPATHRSAPPKKAIACSELLVIFG